jgi:hypothetical protein
MMLLVPTMISERCFLDEAVLYAAFGRIPLNVHPVDGMDEREDFEFQEKISDFDFARFTYQPSGTEISDRAYEAAGIGPCPLVSWRKASSVDRRALSNVHERQSIWRDDREVVLDSSWLRIRELLSGKRLSAFGLPGSAPHTQSYRLCESVQLSFPSAVQFLIGRYAIFRQKYE